jgi:hypothetical protein
MSAMVTMVTMINTATIIALFTVLPWGVSSHPDNLDATDPIRAGQILLRAPEFHALHPFPNLQSCDEIPVALFFKTLETLELHSILQTLAIRSHSHRDVNIVFL